MGRAVAVTNLQYNGGDLRRLASREKNGEVARRLLAIAMILEGISPARAVGAAIITPAVDTEAMNEHLAKISTQVAANAHCLLLCDGAGWHQPGARLNVPRNITLLPLPPYAPELNPMENVWDYLRGNKLSRLAWDSYEAMLEACKQAWLFLVNDPDRIVSIGTSAWAYVEG